MKMRASPGLFLLLLLIGAIIVATCRLPDRVPRGTWHIGQSTSAQAGSGPDLLEQPEGSRANIAAAYGKLPLSFEANRGQTDAHVQFISRGSGYTLYLTATEAVLTLQRPLGFGKPPAGPGSPRVFSKRKGLGETQNAEPKERGNNAHSALRMKLVGANVATVAEGLQPLPGKSNYFIGNDPKKWRTNVPTYAKVKYQRVYPGVDVVYHGTQGQLEYDFVVAPGADPGVIRLSFKGADRLDLDAQGDLVLHTAAGEVREHKPMVYQEIAGFRHAIAGSYVLRSEAEVGFAVGQYDASQPLVIDPALVYSTYLGGSDFDEGFGIAVDSGGNAYVTGSTSSTNFPTAGGPYQAASGGGTDAFVAKLNPTGTALVYSTYLGGSGFDEGLGIAVDPGCGPAPAAPCNAYITGDTSSANFPTTPGAFQPAFGGGSRDAFVVKLNAAGTALVYSTYLGGSGSRGDFGLGIAVDVTGSAYVTGYTDSTNFPTTPGAFQTTFGGGLCYYGYYTCFDAFVTKLNLTGTAPLAYSTYLGGSGDDFGHGIAVDSVGNAYVTGETDSTDFPTTTGAFQTAFGSGGGDAFVTKLNPTGTAPLAYSTYLGGNSFDQGFGIALTPGCGPAPAAPCNAYVTGQTFSANFPTTSGAFQTNLGGPSAQNAFVTKLNPAGTAPLAYSTYLGGSSSDQGNGIAVDSTGSAYVTGTTNSTNFPTTPDAFQPASGGDADAFVTKLNPTGTAPLAYSTYLGGSSSDQGLGIALDSSRNAYVTGFTVSTNFLTTPGAFQPAFGGGSGDAFVAKIVEGPPPTDFLLSATPSSQTVFAGASTTYTVNISRTGGFAGAVTFSAAGLPAGATASFSPNPASGNSSTLTVTTATTTATDSFTVTITGASGSLTHTTSVTLMTAAVDFSLSTTSQVVSPGATTSFNTVNITRNGGFAGAVTLSAAGLPAGATESFSPNPASGDSSTVTVTAATTTPTGSFTVTITGVSGSLTRTTSVTLVVIAGDFGLFATPSSQTVSAGASTSYTVNITRNGGFAGDVTFSAAGLPAGATVSFSPNPASGDISSMVTVTTATTTSTGSFNVTITGASGSLTHTTSVTLVVVAAGDFSLSATPSSQTVSAGASTSYTVNISRTGGLAGAVTFSAAGLPAGATASFSPNPASGNSSTVTVTVTTTARGLLPPWPKLRLPPPTFSVRGWPLWAIGLLVLVLLARRTKTRWQAAVWIFAATVFVVLLVVACGSGSPPGGTQPGTSTLTITGTSGSLTRTTTVTLTVN